MRQFQTEFIPKPRDLTPAPDAPFDLEIGAGAGLHAIQYAKANPERRLVAIERTSEKFEKMQTRFKHHELSNLTIIHADAIHWIVHCCPDHAIKRLFILYPNPEPKNKNQRFAHMPFMSFLKQKLAIEAEITLATNIESYAAEVREMFPLHGYKLLKDELYKGVPRTHFERKYLRAGQSCYNLVFKADS